MHWHGDFNSDREFKQLIQYSNKVGMIYEEQTTNMSQKNDDEMTACSLFAIYTFLAHIKNSRFAFNNYK